MGANLSEYEAKLCFKASERTSINKGGTWQNVKLGLNKLICRDERDIPVVTERNRGEGKAIHG